MALVEAALARGTDGGGDFRGVDAMKYRSCVELFGEMKT
jgi:hypothetical protein